MAVLSISQTALRALGSEVVERMPCLVDPVDSSQAYLRIKKDEMRRLIDGL
jgi:GTP cyclohydrolase II